MAKTVKKETARAIKPPSLKLADTPPVWAEMGEHALMRAHQEGSEASLEEPIHRYQRIIFGYIYRMLQNKHIAEELTQEVFLALVRNADRYVDQGKFASYLFAIASNKIHKEWEQRRVRPAFFSLSFWSGSPETEDGEPTPLEVLSDDKACVVTAFKRGEISDAVNEALKHLPEHYREAFVLRRFMDLSYEEIAEITDCPVGTVKSRVVRAERGLRPYLERFREYL